MKQTKRLIIILSLFLLAACTAKANRPPATVEETAQNTTPTNATNLTLIGQTGRPQFLNAYASW